MEEQNLTQHFHTGLARCIQPINSAFIRLLCLTNDLIHDVTRSQTCGFAYVYSALFMNEDILFLSRAIMGGSVH